jgi:HSP20 family protein
MTTTTTPSTSPERRRRSPWDLALWGDLSPWGAPVRSLFDDFWPASVSDFSPGWDLHETDEAFVLELDLPGVDKKDITIDVSGRRVSIRGVKTATEHEGVMRHTTRTTGTFSYEAVLPVAVDDASVTASLADGVLTVTMPKAPAAKATHVTIT